MMKKLFLVCFFALIASQAYCRPQGAPLIDLSKVFEKGAKLAPPNSIFVKKGDTLYSISREHKLPISAIVKKNDLQVPYKLKVGQLIRLPHPILHTVKPGETVYSVSRKYGVDLKSLIRDNNLKDPYVIAIGQEIRVPKPASSLARSRIIVRDKNGKILSSERWMGANSTQKRPIQALQKKPASGPQKWKIIGGSKVISPKKPAHIIVRHQAPKLAGGSKPRFLIPVKGAIIAKYGPQGGGKHNDGINIAAPRGTKVRSAENGVIVYAGNELRGFGNLILVKHSDGWTSAYAHLEKISVKKGQTIKRGDPIGAVGMTGHISKPQLHFELRRKTKTINPQSYI